MLKDDLNTEGINNLKKNKITRLLIIKYKNKINEHNNRPSLQKIWEGETGGGEGEIRKERARVRIVLVVATRSPLLPR